MKYAPVLGSRGRPRIAISAGVLLLLTVVLPAGAAKPDKQDAPEEPSKNICPAMTKSIEQHLTSIRAISKEIAKAEKGGAASLLGMLKQLAGEPYTNPDIQKKRDEIARKFHLVSDMNSVLTGLSCEPVAIPKDLESAAATGKSKP